MLLTVQTIDPVRLQVVGPGLLDDGLRLVRERLEVARVAVDRDVAVDRLVASEQLGLVIVRWDAADRTPRCRSTSGRSFEARIVKGLPEFR